MKYNANRTLRKLLLSFGFCEGNHFYNNHSNGDCWSFSEFGTFYMRIYGTHYKTQPIVINELMPLPAKEKNIKRYIKKIKFYKKIWMNIESQNREMKDKMIEIERKKLELMGDF